MARVQILRCVRRLRTKEIVWRRTTCKSNDSRYKRQEEGLRAIFMNDVRACAGRASRTKRCATPRRHG